MPEPSLIQRQPVAVLLGYASTVASAVLGALVLFDVIAWDALQVAGVVFAIYTVATAIGAALYGAVYSPATHAAELAERSMGNGLVTLEPAEVPPVDVEALAAALSASMARDQGAG